MVPKASKERIELNIMKRMSVEQRLAQAMTVEYNVKNRRIERLKG